jgi:hypothetical protein
MVCPPAFDTAYEMQAVKQVNSQDCYAQVILSHDPKFVSFARLWLSLSLHAFALMLSLAATHYKCGIHDTIMNNDVQNMCTCTKSWQCGKAPFEAVVLPLYQGRPAQGTQLSRLGSLLKLMYLTS